MGSLAENLYTNWSEILKTVRQWSENYIQDNLNTQTELLLKAFAALDKYSTGQDLVTRKELYGCPYCQATAVEDPIRIEHKEDCILQELHDYLFPVNLSPFPNDPYFTPMRPFRQGPSFYTPWSHR